MGHNLKCFNFIGKRLAGKKLDTILYWTTLFPYSIGFVIGITVTNK